MSALDPRELRNAFGTFMTGVTVVTAVTEEGAPVGFTANSYTSVSLDPPLLLVCPAKSLSSFAVFQFCKAFAVNILAEGQQDVSNIFATSKDDRFSQIPWRADESGCPIIEGAAASFSCAAHERMVAGDHIVLVGRINDFRTSGDAGLGYSRNGYFSLGLERKSAEPPKANRTVFAGAIIEHDGKLLVDETRDGLRPPQTEAISRSGSFTAVSNLFAEAGMKIEFGPVYSIFEDQRRGADFTFYRGIAEDDDPRGFGAYVPVEALASKRFASGALTTMMHRYTLERQTGIFGLYVGDEAQGDVHMFGEGRNR